MFKALSNPKRLQIFVRLMATCPPGKRCQTDDETTGCCVGEVGGDLGLAPSTVSHHIKELRQAGLIRVERRGQTVECWIDDQCLRSLAKFFDETLSTTAGSEGRAA